MNRSRLHSVRRRARWWLDVGAATAMLCASVLLIWAMLRQPPEARNAATDAKVDTPISIENRPVLGSPTAPLVLMVFSDFECPFCATFATETMPALQRDYFDTDAVQLRFFHFPLETIHPTAARRAQLAFCAGEQAQFWPMHDALFAMRPRDPFDQGELAARVGLEASQYGSCVAERGPAAVGRDIALGTQLGIAGTPTVIIGHLEEPALVRPLRILRGAASADVLKAEIESRRALVPNVSWNVRPTRYGAQRREEMER